MEVVGTIIFGIRSVLESGEIHSCFEEFQSNTENKNEISLLKRACITIFVSNWSFDSVG